ncbi:choline-sulfatase [Entomobacter blattae]|uniref:Choline-sulfatase n=1 Tax=Entomobacter blattae TaxID=2762277 RepID=A0A7H1NNV3_9PROT|nr:choline-sulfatase [Entomobacter blattae]QNT77463.1 Choline-sulfatase [Entomobacter blattae]
MPNRAPNFLVIIADQLTTSVLPTIMGGHENSVVIAPTLLHMARNGTSFCNAYTNSPLCGPSRGVLMTGLLPSHSGIYDNASEWPAALPTFGHRLRIAGYQTILSGKMHFVGPEQLHGFEERLNTDIYPADFTWVPNWLEPDYRPNWYHSMDSIQNAGTVLRSNQIDYDEEVAFLTRRKLFDLARKRNGYDPFCLIVSFTHPHDPYNIEPQWWNLYKDTNIPLPRVSWPQNPHPSLVRIAHTCGMTGRDFTQDQIQHTRRAYLGSISYIDHQIKQLLHTLEETDLAKNTIVVFTSDHGDMLGEHGLWYKMSFLEGSTRVPLIFYNPHFIPTQQVPHAVSLIDLGQTLCDFAGTPDISTEWQGKSLKPHIDKKGGHDEVYGEYLGEVTLAPTTMIRKQEWKYIHTPGDPDLLYNLVHDPYEQTNLAEQKAYHQITEHFLQESKKRWNYDALYKDVIKSQKQRALVHKALMSRTYQPWDYEKPGQAHQVYIRNHTPLEDLEAKARLLPNNEEKLL